MVETLETLDAKKWFKRYSVSERFVAMFPMESLNGNISF